MSSVPIPNPPLRVAVAPYKSDGQYDLSGAIMLISAMALAGGIVGVAAHYVEKIFWLIIVFPVLIGLAMGLVGTNMVKRAHLRNPMIGVLAGLLGGITAMGTMHYLDFEEYRSKLNANENVILLKKLPPAELEQVIAESKEPAMLRATLEATASFKRFMDFEAMTGVEISNHGSSPMNLGYYGSYIYWGVEVLIVMGIAVATLRSECARPYCAACREWKKQTTLGGFSGMSTDASKALSDGDVAGLQACGPTPELTHLVLYDNTCPACNGRQSPSDLKLVHFSKQKNGKKSETTIKHISWPGEATAVVRSLFVPAEPPVPPTM